MVTLGRYSAFAEALREPQQVAVRILNEELPLPALRITGSVPTRCWCREERPIGGSQAVQHGLEGGRGDLQVDASAKRVDHLANGP